MDLHSSFRLGRWTINPSHSSVSYGESTIHVEPKVMGVLVALASRNGKVVTREEFIQEVWMGRVVSDEVLSRCISLLRSTLNDDPRKPEYIQTVPRIGYRLVTPVMPDQVSPADSKIDTAESPAPSSTQVSVNRKTGRGARWRHLAELQRRNIFRVAAGYAVIAWMVIELASAYFPAMGAPGWFLKVLTALIVLGWPVALILTWVYEITPAGIRQEREARKRERVTRIRGRKLDYVILSALAVGFIYLAVQKWTGPNQSGMGADTDVPTLAVLPFVNVSQSPADDYFSDGLTEELINAFSRVQDLRVIARTSSFTYKDHNEDIRDIGRKLGAQCILEGSVRKSGDDIRITARLVDGEKGHQLWSETFDGRLEDIFALQDGITAAIVREMLPKLKERGALGQVATPHPTSDLQAYEYFLHGRTELHRRDEIHIRKSMGLFNLALERDPDFAAAYVELATAYALLPYYSYELEDEMFEKARDVLATGTQRNPRVQELAQGVLAFMSFRSWQWVDAEYSFRRALQTSPGDPDLRQWYSQFLASAGQMEGSLAQAKRAAVLDPLSPVVNDRLAVAYLWTNEDIEAQRHFELARDLGLAPGANLGGRVVALLRQGDYQQARKILEIMQGMFGKPTEWIDPFLAGLRDEAARPAAIEAIAVEGGKGGISRAHLFGAWLYLGETERAMDLAFELIPDPSVFNVEFLFSREAERLRAHPRFAELVHAIGLDAYWEEFGVPAICASGEGDTPCG